MFVSLSLQGEGNAPNNVTTHPKPPVVTYGMETGLVYLVIETGVLGVSEIERRGESDMVIQKLKWCR